MQIRCNFPDISYLSETQKNNFQFLNENKADAYNAISLPFLGAKPCLHPFLHLENSLVNLFLRLEQTQKNLKKKELTEFI